MKKTLCLLFAVVVCFQLSAQVEVKSIEVLPGTEGKGFFQPKFSPKGDYLLFTTGFYKGLSMYNLADHSLRLLTDAENAGYQAQISDGGKVVVFRDVEYKNSRRYTSIKRVVTETGDITVVDQPSRDMYAFDFSGGVIRVAKRNNILSRRLVTDIQTVENSYIAAIEDMDLVLYTNNTRKVLNPQGKGSYIWPSISPDNKHLVYTCARGSETGTYVCDMNGENVQCLGYIGAPTWLGNEYIVGMYDVWDDGYTYTKSPIISVRIDGKNHSFLEVPDHPVILYPAANAQGDKIAFEADGQMYMMNVEIK